MNWVSNLASGLGSALPALLQSASTGNFNTGALVNALAYGATTALTRTALPTGYSTGGVYYPNPNINSPYVTAPFFPVTSGYSPYNPALLGNTSTLGLASGAQMSLAQNLAALTANDGTLTIGEMVGALGVNFAAAGRDPNTASLQEVLYANKLWDGAGNISPVLDTQTQQLIQVLPAANALNKVALAFMLKAGFNNDYNQISAFLQQLLALPADQQALRLNQLALNAQQASLLVNSVAATGLPTAATSFLNSTTGLSTLNAQNFTGLFNTNSVNNNAALSAQPSYADLLAFYNNTRSGLSNNSLFNNNGSSLFSNVSSGNPLFGNTSSTGSLFPFTNTGLLPAVNTNGATANPFLSLFGQQQQRYAMPVVSYAANVQSDYVGMAGNIGTPLSKTALANSINAVMMRATGGPLTTANLATLFTAARGINNLYRPDLIVQEPEFALNPTMGVAAYFMRLITGNPNGTASYDQYLSLYNLNESIGRTVPAAFINEAVTRGGILAANGAAGSVIPGSTTNTTVGPVPDPEGRRAGFKARAQQYSAEFLIAKYGSMPVGVDKPVVFEGLQKAIMEILPPNGLTGTAYAKAFLAAVGMTKTGTPSGESLFKDDVWNSTVAPNTAETNPVNQLINYLFAKGDLDGKQSVFTVNTTTTSGGIPGQGGGIPTTQTQTIQLWALSDPELENLYNDTGCTTCGTKPPVQPPVQSPVTWPPFTPQYLIPQQQQPAAQIPPTVVNNYYTTNNYGSTQPPIVNVTTGAITNTNTAQGGAGGAGGNATANAKVEAPAAKEKEESVTPTTTTPDTTHTDTQPETPKLKSGTVFLTYGDPQFDMGANGTGKDFDWHDDFTVNVATSDGKFIPIKMDSVVSGRGDGDDLPSEMLIPISGGSSGQVNYLRISGIANDNKGKKGHRDGEMKIEVGSTSASDAASFFGGFNQVIEDAEQGFLSGDGSSAAGKNFKNDGSIDTSKFDPAALFEVVGTPQIHKVNGKGELTVTLKQGNDTYILTIKELDNSMKIKGKGQTTVKLERVVSAAEATDAPADTASASNDNDVSVSTDDEEGNPGKAGESKTQQN